MTLLILIIGILLRFYHLTSVPPSLSHDETAIAYNAYSILRTGKDEYGKSFPVLFRSFDDYKLPGMVYSTVPFVALFGRTELAARLPSAIYGTLAILVLYLLVFELTHSSRFSTLSALFLAIQPWHVNFSRQLFESNGAVFWFMLGTYFLLRSRKRYHAILWAGLCYVISLYFYYSVRLVIPFILLTYLIFYWKTIMKQWKTTMFSLFVCFLVFLPLGREMLSPGGLERISIVSVVNDPNYIKRRDEYFQTFGPGYHRLALFQTIIENYWKNVSPHNLFVTGTGTYGALYPFEAILLIVGLFSLITHRSFSSYLLLTWLLSAFLPGAFSMNQPNTLRTLIAAPVFAILSGLGAGKIFSKKPSFFLIIFAVTLFSQDFPKFLHAYFIDNPSHNAVSFGDGNKQMVNYVKAHESGYDRIVISGSYWRPYIFLLYWGNVNPVEYQKSGTREKFGKYVFTAASWDTNGIKLMDPSFDPNTLATGEKTLYILSPQELEVQKWHFREIDSISGRRSDRVFVATVEQ